VTMDHIFRDHLPKGGDAQLAELQRRLEKLAKINASLMQRVERSMEQQVNAFSLFQTAIGLEAQVRIRTDELNATLERLERMNDELVSARDSAERANRFKTSFFTAVGHDLLQPLHAARLSLSAMSDGGLAPGDRSLLGQVDHALLSIEDLLRTILDLSKLEAGFTVPASQPVSLSELFPAIIRDLEPIAMAKQLMLSCRESDLQVASDPMMLRRIVQNLVANAVHYTLKGQVKLAARRRSQNVRIEVWDTGPGIAQAERDRIFEEFQRGSTSEAARVGGFGLGLSIVQRMSESLGHSVDLCSVPGRGTCFMVSVPYAGVAKSRSRSMDATGQAYALPDTKVIVIDNEPTVTAAMQKLLENWSCTAMTAAGGNEIEALLTADPYFRPDVVLADFHLNRGETGLDVIKSLRHRFGANLPAVIITADHGLSLAKDPAAHGIEILKKPVKPAELRALMLHLLRTAVPAV
jgi:two-component system, sensor histidine kinase